MKPIVKLILFFGLFILIFGCKSTSDNLPSVYVNYSLDLNKPEYYSLNTPGNYIYITGGLAGIIVYHDLDGSFKAYDRACPYDFVTDGARVYVTDISLGRVSDTVNCGSVFSITNEGVVIKGPADRPLRQYKTYYYPNSNILQITSY